MTHMKNMEAKKAGAIQSARSKPSPKAPTVSIPVKKGGGEGGGMSGNIGKAAAALRRQSEGRDGRKG